AAEGAATPAAATVLRKERRPRRFVSANEKSSWVVYRVNACAGKDAAAGRGAGREGAGRPNEEVGYHRNTVSWAVSLLFSSGYRCWPPPAPRCASTYPRPIPGPFRAMPSP